MGVELAGGRGGQDVSHEGVAPAVPAWSGAAAFVGVGRDEDLDALAHESVDLFAVPVAGIGEHDCRASGDAGGGQFAAGVVDHRAHLAEVRRADRDLGGDDDLLLVADRLGVVALKKAARGLQRPGVRVGDVDLSGRLLGWRVGLGRRAEPAAVLHPTRRAVGLVGGVRAHLGGELFLQAPLGLANPGRTRLRDWASLPLALSVQPPPRSLKPLLASLGGRELRRQLVAAPVSEALVLGGVDLGGLLQGLFGELLVVTRRALRRVGVHPRAIDRQHRDLRQTSLGARAPGPARRAPPMRARGAGETGRSSCDRAGDSRRSRGTRCPQNSRARSPAKSAARARRRRPTAPPSSADRAPAGPVRRRGNRHKTPTDPSPRPPRSQTARSDPAAATHPNSAATRTPARDRTPRSSPTPPHRLKPVGRPPALRNSLHALRWRSRLPGSAWSTPRPRGPAAGSAPRRKGYG